MIQNTVTHTANGRVYEIRSAPTIEGLVVASFRNGKRVSPRYQTTWETALGFFDCFEQRASDMLIEFAKSDLDNGNVS